MTAPHEVFIVVREDGSVYSVWPAADGAADGVCAMRPAVGRVVRYVLPAAKPAKAGAP